MNGSWVDAEVLGHIAIMDTFFRGGALRACLGTVVSVISREGINPSPTKITGVVVVVAGFIPA
jgi:hypothetical protein